MHIIALDQHADFQAWREKARDMCAYRRPPGYVQFVPPDMGTDLLNLGEPGLPDKDRVSVRGSKQFLDRASRVACHSDPERYNRLYSLLWRLQDEPDLMRNTVDADVAWLIEADKAVRRDRHKTHAFVRFRKIGEREDGREQFAAWFEPTHFTLELSAPFFMRRFPNMDWAIITPYRSAVWDGETLIFGPGGTPADVPSEDVVEDQWTAYFSSIFNPARLKVSAMKAEMPVKYWNNLPEAPLIPDMIRDARRREHVLIDSLNHAPNPIAEKARFERQAPMLDNDLQSPEDIWKAVNQCRRCPIGENATQGVAGMGPTDARLMIVGEQPGDKEDLAGKPFIGPAGELLNQALEDAGIDRQQVYVTNAVKHFKYEVRGQRRIHKSPTLAEIKACNHWLEHEIQIVQPDLVLCLGASAARALEGRSIKLSDVRGQIMTRPDGLKFFVTTHPSYVLRVRRYEETPKAYPDLVRDLKSAHSLLAA